MRHPKQKKEDHPFFCHKKQCRKTCYDTPEYMTAHDWFMLKQVVNILTSGTADELFDLLWANNTTSMYTKDFFDRVIGWPEGYVYCRERSYVVRTAFDGMKRHTLPKIQEALKKHLDNSSM